MDNKLLYFHVYCCVQMCIIAYKLLYCDFYHRIISMLIRIVVGINSSFISSICVLIYYSIVIIVMVGSSPFGAAHDDLASLSDSDITGNLSPASCTTRTQFSIIDVTIGLPKSDTQVRLMVSTQILKVCKGRMDLVIPQSDSHC